MIRILKNRLLGCILLLLGLSLQNVFGQDAEALNSRWESAKKQTEENLRSRLSLFSLPSPLETYKFSFLNNQGGLLLSDGFFSKIQYLDESGYPVIYAPHNINAAITTGVNHLQPGGSLGLNLTGKGFVVGIFDQTRPKRDHVEFGNRLTQIDGSTEELSEHSTHVSGTIMASGVNPGAKGMAYEATGWSFNWEADVSKMLASAFDPALKNDGMLISNHSYGIVLGWRQDGANWTWVGNATIDPDEDWRFGFYSSKSQALDELIYSRPYYSVVWSAGNDRDDRGNGTRPPDGPEDTIGPEGVAKNIITVGAVSSVLDYTSSNSVSISSFSSWGPTDDGRIKPDLVGMGVNVFSSSITTNDQDSYASLSGTSMSAPNVTGSLFLLQQLYGQRNPDKFLQAATLKALAIHTAKEAGPAPGPDYMYGWGLLDAKASAELILEENGNSKLMREVMLGQGESFEYEFLSDGITPITATIAWTDPAGSPAGTGVDPTNSMLVNDLDLRIFDEDGVEYFPWTLDPSLGAGARGLQSGDNFRDNVEQVEINTVKPKKYVLKVTHKRELAFGVQPFSLIFTAGTQDGAAQTLYWIGGSEGTWSDPANWSLTANGPSAGISPSESTRVVFDGPSGQNATVQLTGTSQAFSVNVFGDQVLTLDLNSNPLAVSNGFRISNNITEIKNGSILFNSDSPNELLAEFGQTLFENTTLNFQSGKWKVLSGAQFDRITVGASTVDFDLTEIQVNSLQVLENGVLDGNFEKLKFSQSVDVRNTARLKQGAVAQFEGTSGQFNNSSEFSLSALEVIGGTLSLSSDGLDRLKISNGKAAQNTPSIRLVKLELGSAGVLEFAQTGNMTVDEEIVSSATQASKGAITALAQGSTLTYDVYRKLCLDHINVSNVNKIGQGIINLGTTAVVENATGWLKQNCEDVLFAKFDSSFLCVGAAVTFENQSEGAISAYLWNFGSAGTSTLEEPIFVFNAPGKYLVKLTISNNQGSTSFEQEIEIGANELAKPLIVINGSQLTSQQPGNSYQWYLNGQVIPGATARSYVVQEDGSYQVAIFDNICNRVSDPVLVSALPEPDLSRFGIFVGPVPSRDQITVQLSNEYLGPVTFTLVDMAGRVYFSKSSGKNSNELTEILYLPATPGLYLLQIETNNLTLHKKIIKQ